jgi:phage terminase small subunit
MPRKKADKYDLLKVSLIEEMKERSSYKDSDEHLVDNYISQLKLIDLTIAEIDNKVVTDSARDDGGTVANPALVRLPALQSVLIQMAKLLGIGPYSRKLTTGEVQQKQQVETKASMLRPLERRKTN